MIKKLYTNSKIFFKNPHVIRLTYDIPGKEQNIKHLIRKTYKVARHTWGYSDIIYDAPIYGQNIFSPYSSYFCFENELDVLQFRLSADGFCNRSLIWPSKVLFTIHEYIDVNIVESQ